ncbi:hypothetical protein DSO57_1011276 [Entomophthora muscae]|uniref:Uncharacterized protein n=1 Tax=Entomophthora muscae TaxID=34485 RepID=A0ACC2TUV1_9FUNG|nr:hypothetical protein DSO57_1011276 [Entomophthora muscae]
MWILVIIPHHLETASYYPAISITLTLEEAHRAMPVLCLHFQANTNSYSNDTEKVLGVASMLSGDALDWFGKATAEEVEFCLDYLQFERKMMATGNN